MTNRFSPDKLGSAMRRFATIGIAALLAACGRLDAPTATVALSIGAVPERVATISVSAYDVERALIVASATASVPKTSFLLGVPAETPIELRVVARTSRPGPAAVGDMPAYYGAVLRSIPLDRDQTKVAVEVHPAGVLTLGAELPAGVDYPDEVPLRLDPDVNDELPARFVLAPGDPDRPRKSRSFALRRGSWSAAVDLEDPASDDPIVSGGRSIWVEPEVETVAPIQIVPEPTILPSSAPMKLALAIVDEAGRALPETDVVRAEEGAPAHVRVSITPLDANGAALIGVQAAVSVSTFAEPSSIVVDAPPAGESSLLLPSWTVGTTLGGRGRLRVSARARLDDGRIIRGDLGVNVLGASDVPGKVAAVRLDVAEPSALVTGTDLLVELLDAEGLYARSEPGVLDLSASDPWAIFGGLSSTSMIARDRAFSSIPLLRASGPRGAPVWIRATYVNATSDVLDTALTLPILEISP